MPARRRHDISGRGAALQRHAHTQQTVPLETGHTRTPHDENENVSLVACRGHRAGRLARCLGPRVGAVVHAAWPTKPIRLIVPLTPGSATDVMSRVVMDQVSAQLGQPVIVENRPGAGNTIGMAAVAKASRTATPFSPIPRPTP